MWEELPNTTKEGNASLKCNLHFLPWYHMPSRTQKRPSYP